MDFSSLLFSPGPDAAKVAAPQPNAIPQTASPQYPPIPISYPVANPQESVQGPTPLPSAAPAGAQMAPTTPEPAVAAPPAAPGLWEKFQHNPNLMQAALMSGLRLMHGQQNGQDTFGLVSDALMAGNLAYQYNEQNVVEDTRKAAESQSLLKSRDTQTAAAQQQIDQRAQEFPQTLRKLQLDIDNAQTDGERKRAEAAMKVFEADPKRMAEKFNLDRAATRANINQSNAAAASSSATAAEKREAAKMRQWAANGTDEQKAQARQYFTVDDQATNAQSNKNAFLAEQMKKLGWDDAQIAQRLLDINDPTNAKGDTLRGLIYLANEEPDDTRKQEILGKIRTLTENGLAKNNAPKGATPAPGAGTGDVSTRFKADPAMAGNTLGETTPQGTQVLKNGKVIGYYK